MAGDGGDSYIKPIYQLYTKFQREPHPIFQRANYSGRSSLPITSRIPTDANERALGRDRVSRRSQPRAARAHYTVARC